jgi:iron complex outermembrane receptor protein
VLQLSDLIKFADVHAVRVGLEYRNNRGWGTGYAGGTASYQDYAADVMWNWQITPQISLTNSGRVDHLALHIQEPWLAGDPYSMAQFNRATITAFSFNSGLVVQPTANDTLRLLVGRGLQAPSLIDFGYERSSLAGKLQLIMVGNPDLRPSNVTNVELDYDRQVAALSATLTAAVYYQTDRDFLLSPIDISPVLNGGRLYAFSHNYGNAHALGGEFGINGTSGTGWRWNATYSLFTAHENLFNSPPVVPFDFNTATPTSVIDFGLGYTIGKWEADAQGKWQSRFTDYNKSISRVFYPVNINDYVTLNARLGYSVTPRLTLAVAGQEVTAPQIDESAGLPADRRVLLTATYGF